jgi:hypothetical protein
MVTIENPVTPIGDALGTVPAMLAVAKNCQENGEHLRVRWTPNPLAYWAYNLMPKKYDVEWILSDDALENPTHQINLTTTAHYSSQHGLYMTQGFFKDVGLPIPSTPPRAELEVDESTKVGILGDVGLSPFSRCLPTHEKWPQQQWQRLVDAFPDVRFLLYGDERYDDPRYVTGPNVIPFFGYTVQQLVISIRDLPKCVISVSTGTSHIAHAVQQKNILLISQGPFAKNPDAIKIERHVEGIAFDLVRDALAGVLSS